MSSELATIEIKANGIALENIQILSTEVYLTAPKESSAFVRFLPHSTAGFPEMSLKELKIGTAFEISLGYDNQTKEVFSGQVHSQELMVTQSGGADITVVCKQQIAASSGDSVEFIYGENIYEMDLTNTSQGISGVLKVQGCRVAPGQNISLEGASDVFDGTHKVREVLHDVSDGDWSTEVYIGEEPTDEWQM